MTAWYPVAPEGIGGVFSAVSGPHPPRLVKEGRGVYARPTKRPPLEEGASQSGRLKEGKFRLSYPRRRTTYPAIRPIPARSAAAGKSNNPSDGPPVMGISISPFFSIILGCCSMRTVVGPRERPL